MTCAGGQIWVRGLAVLMLGFSLLLLSGPAVGGVIEDAEEILREVHQDGPGRPVPSPPGRPRQLPIGSDSWSGSSDTGVGVIDDGRSVGSKATRTPGRQARQQASAEPKLEGQALAVSPQELTHRKLSLFLLLLLGLLVVLAAALGRGLERSE